MSAEQNAGDLADGMALWQEHRPQTGADWLAVAERVHADGGTENPSPIFAGLLLAVERIAELSAAAPAPSAGFPSSVYVKSAGESGDLLFAVRGGDDPGAVEYRLAAEPVPSPERSEVAVAKLSALRHEVNQAFVDGRPIDHSALDGILRQIADSLERNVEAAVRCCRLAGLRVTPGSRPLPSGVDAGDAEREAGGGVMKLREQFVARAAWWREPDHPSFDEATRARLAVECDHAVKAIDDLLAAPAPSDVQEDE